MHSSHLHWLLLRPALLHLDALLHGVVDAHLLLLRLALLHGHLRADLDLHGLALDLGDGGADLLLLVGADLDGDLLADGLHVGNGHGRGHEGAGGVGDLQGERLLTLSIFVIS